MVIYLSINKVIEETRDLLDGDFVTRVNICSSNNNTIGTSTNTFDRNISRIDNKPNRGEVKVKREGEGEKERKEQISQYVTGSISMGGKYQRLSSYHCSQMTEG